MLRTVSISIRVMFLYVCMGLALWFIINKLTDFSIYLNNYMHPILSVVLCCMLTCVGAGGTVILFLGFGERILFKEEDNNV